MGIQIMTKQTAQESNAIIVKSIASVARTAETLRERVQRTGILIMLHAINHGDWTKANDLVNALGGGVNGKALESWLKDNLGLDIDSEAKAFCNWKGREHVIARLDEAKRVQWFKHKTQKAFEGWNLEAEMAKAIAALIKTADAKQASYLALLEQGETDKASKIVVNFDAYQKLKAFKAA